MTEPVGIDLERSYRAATGAPPGRAGCPAAAELAALAAPRSPLTTTPALRRALEHAAECSACSDELREALALEEWAREAAGALGRDAGAPRIHPFRRWLPTLAAAAVLLLGLGLSGGLRTLPSPPADVVRGGSSSPAGEVAPSDGVRLHEPPRLLSWVARPAERRFRVTLLDAGGTPLWESGDLSRPRTNLPEPIRARLASGGTFYWRVESSDGLLARTSPTYTLRVTP